MVGFGGLLEGRSAMLIAVAVTAPAAVAMALAGWLAGANGRGEATVRAPPDGDVRWEVDPIPPSGA